YMVKFLFTRMTEPQTPTWDHRDPTWPATGDPQDAIWRHLWDWHRGARDAAEPGTDLSVAALADRLGSETEIDAMSAAYELGARGPEAMPALIGALRDENEAASRNAAYAFNGI